MKKLILFAFTLAILVACTNQPARYTTTSPEIDVTKALVKDYQDGNWQSWISHYADTAKVHHNSLTAITPQQLESNFKETLTNYSSYHFSDKDLFYEMIIDDKNETWVYFWGTWEAKVNETNKELVMPVHIALKFINNKIVEEYGYYDTSSITAALIEKTVAKVNEVATE
ncbi:nuclear transport factor 2 family protein [Lutibacter sp.]|uniref:nuclear transport factor 2 family protein n=1 Tax=Lutibacter sp. TaxID=1925666 RepID=UPI0027355994|nr:nuclear transport factor 2 family protein [Lutibacter sp.]MDP3313936.1 nuclear transport factor 2 family protein [Lutibacter sp.]